MCFGYWQNLFRFVLACLGYRWTAGRHPRSSGPSEDQWGGLPHPRSSRNQEVKGDGGQPHWQTCWKDVDNRPHWLHQLGNGAIHASLPRGISSGPTKNIILPICVFPEHYKKYFHSFCIILLIPTCSILPTYLWMEINLCRSRQGQHPLVSIHLLVGVEHRRRWVTITCVGL